MLNPQLYIIFGWGKVGIRLVKRLIAPLQGQHFQSNIPHTLYSCDSILQAKISHNAFLLSRHDWMGGHFQFIYIANMHENNAVKKGVISKFQLPAHCLALEMEIGHSCQ